MKEQKFGHVAGRVHAVRDDRIVIENGRLAGSYLHIFVNLTTNPDFLEKVKDQVDKNIRLSTERKDGQLWLRPPFDPKNYATTMARK